MITTLEICMMTDSICHPRPISEHQFEFQLYSEFVWCSRRCRNAAYSFWVPPVTTAYYTGWKVAILICRIATAKFEAAMPEHFFLKKSKYSTGSIFMERLRDSSGWRACTYLAHFIA